MSAGAATDVGDAGAAAGPRGRRRPVVTAVLAVVLVGAAVLAARRGVVVDLYPAFLPDGQPTAITRYSGPWLTAAAVLLLAAAVAVTAAVSGFRRAARR